MIKRVVKIPSISAVQEFNRICSHFNCDMDLSQGKYTVDAKSIMGIFSLNLEETLVLVANTEDEELVDEKFSKYIID
ncbi:HPr family phosphocarrier protein [Lacrimispora xylanolytica]|uniref:HPr family phosphocarrier protein n=1 Tax=Lacrimispora xylanolytica TaxID=29375 RepID=A0ABY7A8T3_9FIRM|nr:HPr family phosphocarrier protein [Lacrimispora xylanolytica]WAJ22334.1 HPr family phosphocarrier protein [Lacrimispora xylanolytica]